MSLVAKAEALEEATEKARYWFLMWSVTRKNSRYLIRYVRALRTCARLQTALKP